MIVGTLILFACIVLVALLYWGAILMQVFFYYGFLMWFPYVGCLCGVLMYVVCVCAGYFATVFIIYNAMFIRVLAYLIIAINLGILAVNI